MSGTREPVSIAPKPVEGEPAPPILGSWPRLYAAVLIHLAVLIVLFWIFTRIFA